MSKQVHELQTLEDFRDFYLEIPEQKWCTEEWCDGVRCCAYGHLGRRAGVLPPTVEQLISALQRSGITNSVPGVYLGVVDVNDAVGAKTRALYPQPTPKQRIVAYLHDAIKMRDDRAARGV